MSGDRPAAPGGFVVTVEPRKGLVIVYLGDQVRMLTPSQAEDLITQLSLAMRRAATARPDARR